MVTAEALAVAGDLRRVLLAAGVPQVSIELQRGRSGRWVSSGSHGGTSFVANLGHHIASRPSPSNRTPGLAVVKLGRPGLPAPLCNAYGGMDLIARIICLDWANHPGEGGPWVVDGYRIPRDSGRPHLFGWEHEGGYSAAVWDATYTNRATGKSMTYREFMGACHAGTLMWLGRPRTSHGEHKTWADFKQRGRKIDRLGYDRQRGIVELTPFYGSKPQLPATGTGRDEDDMPPYREWSQQDRDALAADVAKAVHDRTVVYGSERIPLGLAVGRAAFWAGRAADKVLNRVIRRAGGVRLTKVQDDADTNTMTRRILAIVEEHAKQLPDGGEAARASADAINAAVVEPDDEAGEG